jgi:hypothetical protein
MNQEITLQEPMNKYTGIKKILRKQVTDKVHTFWAHITDEKGNTLEFRQLYKTVPEDVSEVYSPKQLLDKLDKSN